MGDILATNKDHVKAAKVAKFGKGLALLGVAFDVNEVLEAGKTEAAARAEFEQAAKDWEALAELVDLNDEIVDDWVKNNNLARKATKKRGLANIETARKTLASAIKSTGYDPARR
jgi:DNA-binding SARP family transcriptional activator